MLFSLKNLVVCIEWVVPNARIPTLTETQIFFTPWEYTYLMLIINSYFPHLPYAYSDSDLGILFDIKFYIKIT